MTSHVPTHLLALIESIRADMQTAGCVISSDFKLHVTLGRVNSSDASLSEIKEEISSITPPSFMLTLTDVDYRIYRGRTIYETQLTP
ncbi:MAG: hypothetical protein J5637_02865 [Prevotella sp.]|nr:hypothetical protein [Prevotella sp.]